MNAPYRISGYFMKKRIKHMLKHQETMHQFEPCLIWRADDDEDRESIISLCSRQSVRIKIVEGVLNVLSLSLLLALTSLEFF